MGKPSSKARSSKAETLLVQILSSLGDVELREQYLIDASHPVRNWQDGEYDPSKRRVTINPAPFVVTILVHEMLHHLHPEWSERTVRTRTTQLLGAMSHAQASAIYQEWLARKTQSS